MSIDPERPGIWTEDFKLHSFQVDFRKRATLETLCRVFQETAWNHAEALGVGFEHLHQQGRIWVLSRLLIQLRAYPSWGDTIRVQTWPRPVEAAFAMRDFEMLNRQGEVIVAGSSAWLILDAVSRRPQRPAKLLASFAEYPHRRALPQDPEKIPENGNLEIRAEIPVHYSDIDVNGHVNNARYAAWLVDSYPFEFHRNHSVSSFEINFLGESKPHDVLTSARTQTAPAQFAHSLEKADGSHHVCRARLNWAED